MTECKKQKRKVTAIIYEYTIQAISHKREKLLGCLLFTNYKLCLWFILNIVIVISALAANNSSQFDISVVLANNAEIWGTLLCSS